MAGTVEGDGPSATSCRCAMESHRQLLLLFAARRAPHDLDSGFGFLFHGAQSVLTLCLGTGRCLHLLVRAPLGPHSVLGRRRQIRQQIRRAAATQGRPPRAGTTAGEQTGVALSANPRCPELLPANMVLDSVL